jgi:hypothetical protein
VLVVFRTEHVIKLTFHALCDTVDKTTFGFLVPAASYPADQERVWQRYQILHHLSPLKWKEDLPLDMPLFFCYIHCTYSERKHSHATDVRDPMQQE